MSDLDFEFLVSKSHAIIIDNKSLTLTSEHLEAAHRPVVLSLWVITPGLSGSFTGVI